MTDADSSYHPNGVKLQYMYMYVVSRNAVEILLVAVLIVS